MQPPYRTRESYPFQHLLTRPEVPPPLLKATDLPEHSDRDRLYGEAPNVFVDGDPALLGDADTQMLAGWEAPSPLTSLVAKLPMVTTRGRPGRGMAIDRLPMRRLPVSVRRPRL